MSDPFRVIAIIAAFNEGDIVSSVIRHLVKGGIDVYLIDNHSTDDTVDQARQWLGQGLIHIESFPNRQPDCDSPERFDWTAILRRKEELARELKANWFIHHDADEIREGPWPGLSLKEAIQRVDSLGFNCIDFRAFNFPPIDNGFRQGYDPAVHFTFYEPVGEFDLVQLKCWKATGTAVSLVSSAGHNAQFPGRLIFPIRFLLRHYPVRTQEHGIKKVFSERKERFLERERSQGWHIQYDQIEDKSHGFLRKPEDLSPFDLNRARFELMLPDNAVRDLADRLARTDAELIQARLIQRGAEQGLAEYREHAINQEHDRDRLTQQLADLERDRGTPNSRVVDLERGLEERSEAKPSLSESEAPTSSLQEPRRKRTPSGRDARLLQFCYAPAITGEGLILRCRPSKVEGDEAIEGDLFTLHFRWFDDAGKTLIWESEEIDVELHEEHWLPFVTKLPLMPEASQYLRFEIVAENGEERVPIAIGFLFDEPVGRPEESGRQVMALNMPKVTAVHLPHRSLNEAASDPTTPTRVLDLIHEESMKRTTIDLAQPQLLDIMTLIFLDWYGIGRRLATLDLLQTGFQLSSRIAIPRRSRQTSQVIGVLKSGEYCRFLLSA